MEDQLLIDIRNNLDKLKELQAKLLFSIREIKYLMKV